MKASSIDNNNNFIVTYYQHQYNRMEKHESYRMAMSNFVLGISAVAFTFGFPDGKSSNLMIGIVLPVLVMATNVFVILYFRYALDMMKVHRRRAKRILEVYAPEIHEVDQEINWERSSSQLWSHRRVQAYFHGLIALISILPILAYLGVIGL